MTNVKDDLPLAREFPAATESDWRKLVDGVLKGAAFDKKLVNHTYDRLRIAPLYERARNAHALAGRGAAPWQVVQRVDHPDAAIANRLALEELESGATGLALVFAGSPAAHGFGLEPSAAALTRALEDIHLDAGIAIDFRIGPQSKDIPAHFAALLKQRGIAPAKVNARFGFDPIGAMAAAGSSPYVWADIAKVFTPLIQNLASHGFKGPLASADGRIVHDAGGSEAQELAFVLAVAVQYLRTLEQGGVALDDARRMISVRLAADADQFLTMAKFRAMRKLWARIEQACGFTPAPLFVAGETAWRMLTQRDPYVNMLRATSATVAAGLAGADAITVLPHTLALGLPDAFARRVARNTQLVLIEESNLARVADPAAGSGGIESLTAELCTAAWALFQEIEKAGGATAALEANLIQPKIATAREARAANIARRKDALTGATDFPNIHEAPSEVLAAKPITLPPYGEAKIKFDALVLIRLAAPFEALRDKSDRLLATTGARPKIFLANLGTPSDFTARTTFAKNFFEAGGIEAVGNDGFVVSSSLPAGERSTPQASGEGAESGLQTLVAAFKASGAKFACLCSSDKVYEKDAAAAAKALTAAGATTIYLAGRPGEHEAAYKAAGIADFAYAGGDVLKTLQAAYDILGQAK